MKAHLLFPPGSWSTETRLEGHGFLLYGARRSGKTSMAFQAAINVAQGGGHVLVVCQETALCTKMPQPAVPLSSLPEDVLRRIEFIYVDHWAAATRELFGLTVAEEVPSLLLIDDDCFADREDAARVGECLSWVENLVDWMHRCGRTLVYVVVLNETSLHGLRVPLAYGGFPLVGVRLDRTGAVEMRPLPWDAAPMQDLPTWRGDTAGRPCAGAMSEEDVVSPDR